MDFVNNLSQELPDENILKFKLIIFQTFYLMLNIEKHSTFEEQNWFYKYYQNFFIYTCNMFKINENIYKNTNLICFPDNNMNIEEMKDLYCYIYNYILKNKIKN